MRDTHLNWKWGEVCPISARTPTSAEVRIGQMLFLNDRNEAVPASFFDSDRTLTKERRQKLFRDRFLGVSMQRSPIYKDNPVRIATRGVFEFKLAYVPPEPLLLGQYFTSALTDRGRFEDRVVETCSPEVGIMRLIHTENVPYGKVYVAIRSTITERWD